MNPSLYELNTRVWLNALSTESGRPVTLDDIPDRELDRLAGLGFDLIYLLGIWKTGAAGREVSLRNGAWRAEFARVLPDLTEDDICGSCFAISAYEIPEAIGGEPALHRLRTRLRERGQRLILDFVANHTSLDHPWVQSHPEFYVRGSEEDLGRQPGSYVRLKSGGGNDVIVAHGRDPYFPSWPDTLQLDYGNPQLQEAMLGELLKAAGLCDGLRCDTAMLILPSVFARTWGTASEPFWPRALERLHQQSPGFVTMAEVYWDLEFELQQQGFDYTYDKPLYERLRDGRGRLVREHLKAATGFQRRSVRFLENHDEPRAVATFAPEMHRAAAVITFLCPGLRFFYQGQLEGAKAHLPVHLCRAPVEPVDVGLADFYRELLSSSDDEAFRAGTWRLVDPVAAWEGNWTWDCFVAFVWEGEDDRRLLIAVNYGGGQSQCYLELPWADLAGRQWRLDDRLGKASYDRDGDTLLSPGLYLDMPAWGYHFFELLPL